MKDFRLAFALLGIGAFAFAFLSPLKVVFGLLGATAIVATFFRPASALPYLMVLVAVEPFALKWVPDELYIYARYFSEILIYTIAAGVCKDLFLKKIRFQFPAAFAAVALLAAVAILSAFVNETPAEVALLGMRQIFRYLVLFACVVLLQLDRVRTRRLVATLIALVAFESALGLGQALVGAPLDDLLLPGARKVFGDIQLTAGTDQFWESGQRVFATMGRYDQLGTFLAFGLLLMSGMHFNQVYFEGLRGALSWAGRGPRAESKGRESETGNPPSGTLGRERGGDQEGVPENRQKTQTIVVLVFIAGLAVLVLTYSRASWFGFLLGLFYIGVLVKRNKKILAAYCIAAALFSGYLLYSWSVISHMTDTPRQTIVERLSESLSFERWRGEYIGLGRLYYIFVTPTKVVASSPLFGVGPGSYGAGTSAALHYTTAYEKADVPFGIYGTEGYIDNNWFSLWGELGTVGLALYVLLFMLLIRKSLAVYRTSSDPLLRSLALGFVGVVAAVSLQAFLGTYLEVRTLAFYFWLFAGVIMSYENPSRS